MKKELTKLVDRDNNLSPSIISGLLLVLIGAILLILAFFLDKSVVYGVTALGFGFSALGIAAPLESLTSKLKK